MSKILDSVRKSATCLYDACLIDAITMHEFAALCLKPLSKFTPNKIKKLRLQHKVSQPVFAQYLNVSASTIKKWETGEKHPSGAALRLLQIVQDNGLGVIQ